MTWKFIERREEGAPPILHSVLLVYENPDDKASPLTILVNRRTDPPRGERVKVVAWFGSNPDDQAFIPTALWPDVIRELPT